MPDMNSPSDPLLPFEPLAPQVSPLASTPVPAEPVPVEPGAASPGPRKPEPSQAEPAELEPAELEPAELESAELESADEGTDDSRVANELQRLNAAAKEDGLLEQEEAETGEWEQQVELAAARLGLASGLFVALQRKHPPTASHCLRVALICSGWAQTRPLSEQQREVIEVAALLHDIGKIGVPDRVLAKPGRLADDEQALMDTHRDLAADMLRSSGTPQAVVEAVVAAGEWFDGSTSSGELVGEQIPLAARMLAIVDAFDSMTTDHVYRPARSRERALAELFEHAGRQFDPELVQHFNGVILNDQRLLTDQVASRWLAELAEKGQKRWPLAAVAPKEVASGPVAEVPRTEPAYHLFEEQLINNMHDGVIFIDAQRKVFLWNAGTERLTGVSSAAAHGQVMLPSLLQMSEVERGTISDEECPFEQSIRSGSQVMRRVGVLGRSGRHVTIDLLIIPVIATEGTPLGATVLMRDASTITSLEEKCQALHAQMTKDPMTQVANRAEFDRMLPLFMDVHQETNLPCSLIMTDIDHFKHINDTYGHQAGDEAIVTFASLLKSMCRSGDMVARYGGEEFAILCADCNNATAAVRAEQLRKRLAETSHAVLAQHAITASFGVTELQLGDTPETLLRRSDRALLQAKDQGRNQVVQLGSGVVEEEPKRSWWTFKPWSGQSLIDTKLVTNVPIELAIEKLRGFISDHDAKLGKVTSDQVRMDVTCDLDHGKRGFSQLPLVFVVDVQFDQFREFKQNTSGFASGEYVATRAAVRIRPKRERDRRRKRVAEQARLLLGSLRSYLMAKEVLGDSSEANTSGGR